MGRYASQPLRNRIGKAKAKGRSRWREGIRTGQKTSRIKKGKAESILNNHNKEHLAAFSSYPFSITTSTTVLITEYEDVLEYCSCSERNLWQTLHIFTKGTIKSDTRFTVTASTAAERCFRPNASDLSAPLSGDGCDSRLNTEGPTPLILLLQITMLFHKIPLEINSMILIQDARCAPEKHHLMAYIIAISIIGHP